MGLGGALHEEHLMFFGKFESLIVGDGSSDVIKLKLILVIEVGFVAYEHDGDFIVGVAFGLVEPFVDVVEGLSAGYVIHQNYSY